MLPNTPPTYVGTKRRTGPVDFHINKMRALNLSAKYMKKVEDELRGLPGSFSDLPMTPLMKIGAVHHKNDSDELNRRGVHRNEYVQSNNGGWRNDTGSRSQGTMTCGVRVEMGCK